MREDPRSNYVGVTAASPFNNFIHVPANSPCSGMRSEQRWLTKLEYRQFRVLNAMDNLVNVVVAVVARQYMALLH